MSSAIDMSELEKEMMELFDDYGYNKEEKAKIEQMLKNKKNIDDIGDEHYIDMNYIETSNQAPSSVDYTTVQMVQPEPDLVGGGFINDILNDKLVECPKKKTLPIRNDVFLIDDLDSESREKIKKELADENSDIFNTMEEHSETLFHINKLRLIKDKIYKSFFKRRRRSSVTSTVSETEIELDAKDIEYVLEKEFELIGILLKNVKRYLVENNIKYNDNIFDLDSYDGYKIVDNPKEEIVESCGIIFINVVPSNKDDGYDCVCYNNKCVATSIKKNMIITTKDFHKFRYINTDKLLFKKVKMNDIGYLIEKHKK